ncbi:MAG: hypothetical protein ACYDBA_12850 [Sulfuricaulis sp.]
MAYVIFVATLDGPHNGMQTRGVLYLALLPYFFGALVNKEGYWERPESVSELLYPSERMKKSRALSRVVRVVLVVLLFGLGTVTYQAGGGYGSLKGLALVVIGALWGGMLTRAWFIYQQRLAVASRRTQ